MHVFDISTKHDIAVHTFPDDIVYVDWVTQSTIGVIVGDGSIYRCTQDGAGSPEKVTDLLPDVKPAHHLLPSSEAEDNLWLAYKAIRSETTWVKAVQVHVLNSSGQDQVLIAEAVTVATINVYDLPTTLQFVAENDNESGQVSGFTEFFVLCLTHPMS